MLVMLLCACGVRDGEMGNTYSSESTGQSISSSQSSSSNSSTTASTALGQENQKMVPLTFSDAYTGFWQNSEFPENVTRLSFGELAYHSELFRDASFNQGADSRNCFIRTNLGSLLVYNGKGLRDATSENKTVNYYELTVQDDIMVGTYYDSNGIALNNDDAITVFNRVFRGLAVDGLQVCVEN